MGMPEMGEQEAYPAALGLIVGMPVPLGKTKKEGP